jgi:hypothetical protein
MSLAEWTDFGLMAAVVVALLQFRRATNKNARRASRLPASTPSTPGRAVSPWHEVLPVAALVGAFLCAEASGLPVSLPAAMGQVGQAMIAEQRQPAAGPADSPAAAAARASWLKTIHDPQFGRRLLLLFFSLPLAQVGLAGLLLLLAPGARSGAAALSLSLTPILLGAPLTALAALLIYLWQRNPFRTQPQEHLK